MLEREHRIQGMPLDEAVVLIIVHHRLGVFGRRSVAETTLHINRVSLHPGRNNELVSVCLFDEGERQCKRS